MIVLVLYWGAQSVRNARLAWRLGVMGDYATVLYWDHGTRAWRRDRQRVQASRVSGGPERHPHHAEALAAGSPTQD